MRFQTTCRGGLAQFALDAHRSECALGVNAPNRIRCASNSLPSASVNGPLVSSPYHIQFASYEDFNKSTREHMNSSISRSYSSLIKLIPGRLQLMVLT